jgi:rod shape-determining protein MreD
MAHDRKTNIIYILIVGLTSLLLQAFFVPIIEIGVWRPDVVLLAVLYIGYRYGVIAGILSGFILGIFQDSMSPLPLGMTSLTNSVIGFAAGQIRQFKLAYNARILASVILILIQGCIFYFFYQFRAEVNYGYLLLTRVFPNTIYTFLIGLLISFFNRSKIENI